MQPAIHIYDLRGGDRIIEISLHDTIALYADFIFIRKLILDKIHKVAECGRAFFKRIIDIGNGYTRCRFCLSETGHQCESQRVFNLFELLCRACAAAYKADADT